MNFETIFEKQLANNDGKIWFILVEDDTSKVASHPVKNINSLELNGYEHKMTFCGHPFFYKVSL
jgi:hypothetical protein